MHLLHEGRKLDSIRMRIGSLGHGLLSLSKPKGEDQAQRFAELYETQFGRVYAYLRFRLGDNALAEDLAEEVFVRAWESIDTMRKPESAVSWLFTTAKNLAADYYRHQRDFVPIDYLSAEQHPTTGSAEEIALIDEQCALIGRFLTELDERSRTVFGLRFVAGLRNPEIARVTKISEGNVAVILHRALRTLRERLGVEGLRDV